MDFYSDGRLTDTLSWVGGALRFSGHDLRPPSAFGDEYEYWITVPPQELPALAAELGVDDHHAALVAALGERAEEIVGRGERTWLTERGIKIEFFAR
jgi:hypothetical protein